jgi:hypothetical protein
VGIAEALAQMDRLWKNDPQHPFSPVRLEAGLAVKRVAEDRPQPVSTEFALCPGLVLVVILRRERLFDSVNNFVSASRYSD